MLIYDLDVDKANEDVRDRLLHLVPTYERLAATSKVHLIQSIVSRLLIENVFEKYFVGLPDTQAEQFSSMETYLSTFGEITVLTTD